MELDAAIERALGASAYLQRALQAHAASEAVAAQVPSAQARSWLRELAAGAWSAARVAERYSAQLHALAPGVGQAAAVARALRRTRRHLLCGLMIRDVAGLAPLEEVTGAMSAFADLAVGELLRALSPELAQRYAVPVDASGRPSDLMVFAMGKAGAGELNVSSDLDLVFVAGENGDGQEFFERLGRRLIAGLADVDADGFVFRVDMRLRPHGDAGPLVVSSVMLEEYFLREGREWERFAWAKSRLMNGPVLASARDFAAQGQAVAAVVHGFVYRKYFDFGAIGAIRDLHRRIRAEAARAGPRRKGARGGHGDVKLGRGGIREIEFLAQSFAIMRGGRDPGLRAQGTVGLLRALALRGLLADAQAADLIEHYRFLRRLEHCLQYRDDAQTHVIPQDAGHCEAVARLLGEPSAAAMLSRYRHCTAYVARAFDTMFPADAPGAGGNGAPAINALDEAALAQAGFADPAAAAAQLQRLLASVRVATMSAGTRAIVEQLARQAVAIIGRMAQAGLDLGAAQAGGADRTLLRWIQFAEVIGRRSTYFSLLAEYPRAHERVLDLLASGGWGTQYLLRHPIVLDELIDPRERGFGAVGPPRYAGARLVERPPADVFWQPWRAQVQAQLQGALGDGERQMNLLRDAHHAQVFRLLLEDLSGNLALERLADHLSSLADAVLALALRGAWETLDAGAGGADLPPIAIIAYGKLGGRELGYASDLDLIFVYDEGADAGQAERNASQCTLLVRRLIGWLTSVTSSGMLFDIDLRLRPNGNSGLLVTPIAAFERYQCNADGHGAWVWEHQALTRARACAGDAALGRRVEDLRVRVLQQARDPQALAAEVVSMRRRMLEEHRNAGGRFDLKHDRGGMVDIEFLVQYLVLAHARAHPELLANRGNIGLLEVAARAGLIDAPSAQACADAYRHYRQLQHALRLDGAERAQVERAPVQDEIDAVLRTWCAVLGTTQP